MFEEITQADLVNKGVEGLPDTPNLETAEMQRKFDEITKEVIVPKFNALIQKLNNDLGSDISMIDPKDDTSKTLSALIGEIEEEVGLNTDDRHNHANKALLDSLTAILFEGYNRLVTMLAGVDSVTDVVTNDTTVIPSGKAIVDFVQQMGGGDMLKEVYDTDNDGVVDNSEALNGHPDSYFATVTALQALGSLITALQSLVLAVGTSESTPADTWTALQALKGQNIARLQMNALGDAKIFKSADGGSTWDGGSPVGGDKSDLATVEPGTTATAPYAAGDHVVVNNVYHEVTAAIAIGDTFVEGTNIDVRTVGGEITALNQNLTLSYDNTSYSGQQDINSTLQAILEQVFPSVLNLNDKSSADWTQATGSNFTSFNPLKSSNYARADYNNLIDYSKYSKIAYTVSKSSNDNLLILEKNEAFPRFTITGSGVKSGEIDISSVTGFHSIAIQSNGGNVQFSTFELK
jgi:hypothetical protein